VCGSSPCAVWQSTQVAVTSPLSSRPLPGRSLVLPGGFCLPV
jgi:hypothetical protein